MNVRDDVHLCRGVPVVNVHDDMVKNGSEAYVVAQTGMNGCKVIPEWNTLISPGFCGSNVHPKGSLFHTGRKVPPHELRMPLELRMHRIYAISSGTWWIDFYQSRLSASKQKAKWYSIFCQSRSWRCTKFLWFFHFFHSWYSIPWPWRLPLAITSDLLASWCLSK